MKKFLSVLLSMLMIILSVVHGFSVFAIETDDKTELSNFADALVNLVRTYDQGNSEISDEFVDTEDNLSDSDNIIDSFPITYSQTNNDTAEFFTNDVTVKVYNNSNILTVNHQGEEYSVVADENVQITDDGANVPVEELFESFGYQVQQYSDYVVVKHAFASKRIIIKSETPVEDVFGAVDCISGYKDLYIFQYDDILVAKEAYEYYSTIDEFEYVEPDIVRIMQTVEPVAEIGDFDAADYYYEVRDKALSYVSEDIGFEAVKDKLAQRVLNEVTVAVLDSGVDSDHELLVDRILPNDVNLSSTGDKNSCEDDYGHGTHVSGIIVDNTLSNVKIKPYKILNNQGKGSTSLIAVAIDMAVADGADIINLSLSAEGENKILTESIDAATENGVNVIVAAGNSSKDLSAEYVSPACIDSAVTVSSITKNHILSSYSNYNGPIDICAPGDNVKSSYLNNTYTLMSGTSMAAPQVTAGFAIVRSVYEDKTASEVEEMVEEYAVKLVETEGQNHFGSGLVYLKYILEKLPRAADVEFSVEGGEFNNTFKLALSCPEEDATILYVLNGGEDINIGYLNGEKYKTPLTISVTTKVSAVAIVKGKMVSNVKSYEYIRSDKTEEDFYDIDSSGMILGYVGNQTDLVVPDTIRGITVTGIGSNAFKNSDKIHSVTLPITATRIASSAFYGCTNLETVSGEGITRVDANAFQISTIKNFPFSQLTRIGSKAFSGCNNLQNVDLSNVKTIESSAFENAQNIGAVDLTNIQSIAKFAFRSSDITSVNLPETVILNEGVFNGCKSLTSVTAEKCITIGKNCFQNCISLSQLNFPVATTICTDAFYNTALKSVNFPLVNIVQSNAFTGCSILKAISLPEVETLDNNAFFNCAKLQFAYFPKLKTINNYVFSGCSALKSLWLPSVTTISNSAFNNSNIEYLQFDSAKTIADLPESLQGLVLPTVTESITAETPTGDFVVYGFKDTFAETYATEKQKEFKELPAIVYELQSIVNAEEKYIIAYALGYNCTYQWYKNDTLSNENGVAIEGATKFYYEPSRDDGAIAYYCVITSNDGLSENTITTSYIENAFEYREADYTEYNEVMQSVENLDRSIYTPESLAVLDEIANMDISGYSLAEQGLITEHIASINTALGMLEYLYTLGDVNDDGKISIIDARIVLQAISMDNELETVQGLSADVNKDGNVSLVDARIILRVAIGLEEIPEI